MIDNRTLDLIERVGNEHTGDTSPIKHSIVMELIAEVRELRAFGLEREENHRLTVGVLNDSHRALAAENERLREALEARG